MVSPFQFLIVSIKAGGSAVWDPEDDVTFLSTTGAEHDEANEALQGKTGKSASKREP